MLVRGGGGGGGMWEVAVVVVRERVLGGVESAKWEAAKVEDGSFC